MPTFLSIPHPHYPFGSSINTRSFSAGSGFRFGFNTQEKDKEIYNNNETYTATFWEYDGRLGRRWNVDPKPLQSLSVYSVFQNNPILAIDIFGDSAWLYTTTLPGNSIWFATHSFIVVKTKDNLLHYYVYGPANDNAIMGGSQLIRKSSGVGLNGGYSQDKAIIKGKDLKNLREKILIDVPQGVTQAKFDEQLISVAESFGNNTNIEYKVFSNDQASGNCNTSTSTILSKAGVSVDNINKIERQITGINWGFGDIKPWTKEEQKKAVQYKQEVDAIKSEQEKTDGHVKP